MASQIPSNASSKAKRGAKPDPKKPGAKKTGPAKKTTTAGGGGKKASGATKKGPTSKDPGIKSYPVWVGNLHEAVDSDTLRQQFSGYGVISSCHIKRSEDGKSRNLGYVNFTKRSNAERAAKGLAKHMFFGQPIRTKGPQQLDKEGHSKKSVDFRPLTDCSFGPSCQKGDKCPYRHVSRPVAASQVPVCEKWREKNCMNKQCPKRHPTLPQTKQRGSSSSENLHNVFLMGPGGTQPTGGARPVGLPGRQPIRQWPGPTRMSRHSSDMTLSSHEDGSQYRSAGEGLMGGTTASMSLLNLSNSDDSMLEFEYDDSSTEEEEEEEEEEDWEEEDEDEEEEGSSELSNSMSPGAEHLTPPSPFTKSNFLSRSPLPPSAFTSSFSSSTSGNSPQILRSSMDGRGAARPLIGSSQSFSMSDEEEGELEDNTYDRLMSDGEDDGEQAPQSLTRLMSLEARRGGSRGGEETGPHNDESDEEDEEGGKSVKHEDKGLKKTTAPVMANPVPLEPVGLFWDIENCPVPVDKSAFSLAKKMRSSFFDGKREAEFMCVCDIKKERGEVIDELHKAHVTIVHVNAIAKNAADDKLRQSLRKFANTYAPPATVVLVSGDINFSPELNDLNHVHNFRIVLLHNLQATEALKVCAHSTLLFDEFVSDVEAYRRTVAPSPTTVLVRGLPSNDPSRLRSRLSRLADNCGGKVIDVSRPPGTARVLFKSQDVARKAQKRMNGEDVYGSRITVELEENRSHNQVQPPPPRYPRPDLMRAPPPHYPRPDLMRAPPPHYPRPDLMRAPPPVAPAQRSYHPRHQSFPVQRPPPPFGFLPPPHAPPPPHPLYPPSVLPPFMGQPTIPLVGQPFIKVPSGDVPLKFLVKGIRIASDSDTQNVISLFTEIRLACNVRCSSPQVYWSRFSEVSLVTEFDLFSSASIRKETLILNKIKEKSLSPKIAEKFASACASDIMQKCKEKGWPWEVFLLTRDKEEDVILCSNVVSLLRKYEKHWCLWGPFVSSYGQTYQTTLSQMMIESSCNGAVTLLTASVEKDNVLIFSEFSPIVSIDAGSIPTLLENTCKLLMSARKNRIKILEFVEAYQKRFGSLPVSAAKKRQRSSRNDLQNLLVDYPLFMLTGDTPATMFIVLRESNPKTGLSSGKKQEQLEIINKEFVELLSTFPDKQLPLNKIQQEYQTHFHKSIRVSDIIPGASGMGHLLNQCPGIQVRRGPRGVNSDTVVTLTPGAAKQMAAAAVDSTDSPVNTNARIEEFKQQLIEILLNSPSQSLQLFLIPSEFTRHFQKPFVLANYGAKKLTNLVMAMPDIVEITKLNNESFVTLIRKDKETAASVSPPIASSVPIPINSTNPVNTSARIEEFKQQLVEILMNSPSQSLKVFQIPLEFEHRFKKKFYLANYGAKKLTTLLMQMLDIVEIIGEGNDTKVQLLKKAERTEENQELKIEELLFSLPSHRTTLDRFLHSYESYYQRKLPNYGVHGKLISYLEEMKDTIVIVGAGPKRDIILSTLRVFACEMRSLLLDNPEGIIMPQVVPLYKTKFGKEFNPEHYGRKKLLQVLEDIPDVVEITGEGARRYIKLNKTIRAAPIKVTQAMQETRRNFLDEVTCLLVNARGQRLTLHQLSNLYCKTLGRQIDLHKLGYNSVLDAVTDLYNVKVSTEGPGHVIQLLPDEELPPIAPTQGKETPPVQDNGQSLSSSLLESEQEWPDPTANVDQRLNSPSASPLPPSTTSPLPPSSPPSSPPPPPTTSPPTSPPPLLTSSPTASPVRSPPKDEYVSLLVESTCLRLCSEVHRILLCHPEHSMTLTELCEEFDKNFDPANAKPADILYCIKKYNGRKYEFKLLSPETEFPMVFLRLHDSLWKLGKDIQYLFVYKPVPNYTMPVESLESLYKECYGRKLNPRVYASLAVTKLLKNKLLRNVLTVTDGTVSLSIKARLEVFASLTSELLFFRGPECTTMNHFMKCYREHFGVPLMIEELSAETLETLSETNELSPFVKVTSFPEPHFTFTSQGLFCEQLRHLLTIHENSIPLSLLPTVYLSEFHRPEDPDIYNWLSSPLHHAPHVIHYAAEDVIVWAPTGRPYPLRGGQSLEAPEYLKADIEELGSVPEELASRYQNMVEDPLPSISLEFLDPETVGQLLSEKGMEGFSLAGGMEGIHGVNDSELNQFLVLGDVDTGITREEEEEEALDGEEKAFGSEEEDKGEKRLEDESVEIIKVDTVNHVHEVTSNTVPTSTISDAAGPNNSYSTLSSDEYPPTTTTACAVAPSIDDVHARPPSQGLDHGQFAGLLPQDVVELMRESLSAVPEDDVQGKVKTMSQYIDYFGELSAREMERVDGPPKQKTRGKRKQKLAIRFSTSMTDHPQLPPQSSLPHALFENGEECEPIPQQK